MSVHRPALGLLIVAVLIGGTGCRRAEPTLTPEQARAKGEELLRAMSTSLSSSQSFSFTADERRDVAGAGGSKTERRATRQVSVRRPNALTVIHKGDSRDGQSWYDGKQLTVVAHGKKVWARGPMPGTLDEAIDFISAEYALQLPTADLLYSNPYDAMMTPETTGGWVDRQQVGNLQCDHLSYSQPVVDWEIWLGPDRHLPCQVKITYKNEPGKPATLVTFSNWNPSPQFSADTFTPKVPDGYQRLKMMRHATVVDEKAEADAAAAEAAAAKSPKKK